MPLPCCYPSFDYPSLLARIGSIACLSVAMAAPATALTVYDDKSNRFGFGGYLGVFLLEQDGDVELVNSSSRLRFTFERQLAAGWESDAVLEWGFNPISSGNGVRLNGDSLQSFRSSDFIFNRLGFLAFSNARYGRFSFGKQWSIYSNVSGFTDQFISSGGLASGTYNLNSDGGLSGTGRADSSMQYQHSYNGVKFGLQYQARTDGEVQALDSDGNVLSEVDVSYDDSYGVYLGYDWAFSPNWQPLSFGIAYNRGDYESNSFGGGKDEALIYGVRYGTLYQPGLYAAVTYADTENHEVDNLNGIFDGDGYELMLNWTFNNKVTLVSGLNLLESVGDRSGEFKRKVYIYGLHYVADKHLRLYLEAVVDDSDLVADENGNVPETNNKFGVGARYFF